MSGVLFAASVLILIGCFQVIAGLVAIFDDEFYVVARNYTFNLDTSAWGWLHLLLGAAARGDRVRTLHLLRSWAIYTAIGLAILSAIANFFFIPYYPFVVDPRDRTGRLGHLGAHPAGGMIER